MTKWDSLKGSCNILNSINVIHTINGIKDKNHTTFSIDGKKHLTKSKTFHYKTTQKIGIDENFFNLIFKKSIKILQLTSQLMVKD